MIRGVLGEKKGAMMLVTNWRTSTRSSGGNGTCVEVGVGSDSCLCIAVRDSKDRTGPTLRFDRSQWGRFIDAIR